MMIFVLVSTWGIGYLRRIHWSVGGQPRYSSVGGGYYGWFGGRRSGSTAVGDGGRRPWWRVVVGAVFSTGCQHRQAWYSMVGYTDWTFSRVRATQLAQRIVAYSSEC
jgi:hypothetical protein